MIIVESLDTQVGHSLKLYQGYRSYEFSYGLILGSEKIVARIQLVIDYTLLPEFMPGHTFISASYTEYPGSFTLCASISKYTRISYTFSYVEHVISKYYKRYIKILIEVI